MDLETPPHFQYEVNKMYAITIAPSDKYQFQGKQCRQTLFRNFVSEHICGNLDCDYTLVIEYSHPFGKITGPPRLHLHGTISFPKKSSLGAFLNIGLFKLLKVGYIKIGHINDPKVWMDYMLKGTILKDSFKIVSNCEGIFINSCDKFKAKSIKIPEPSK